MSSSSTVFVGVDIGSATVKVAGVDQKRRLVGDPVYLRHDDFPSPVIALKHALQSYLTSIPGSVGGIGATGSGRELNKHLIGADITRTEIFAHAVGVTHFASSKVGTVIEIGGQDSKIIIFDQTGLPTFFNMNTICSAGTGEFLKQLADEAGVPLAELGSIALQSRHPARIDATCTVFSKRDFRHLTQKGVPLADRLMGACQAMVRNYLTNVAPQEQLAEPVFFQGGVAFNTAVRHAFSEELHMPVVVPPHHELMGALGMAILVCDEVLGATEQGGQGTTHFRPDFFEREFHNRIRYCHGCENGCELSQLYQEKEGEPEVLETLGGRCEASLRSRNVHEEPRQTDALRVSVVRRPTGSRRGFDFVNSHRKVQKTAEGRYFAGLDGGSRGTKFALIRSDKERRMEIVAADSIDTAGDAISACMKALEQLQKALPKGAQLDGIGTTGSAGELFRDIVTINDSATADPRSTEIIAHYVWARHLVPEVGTVIDIGGNDAKIISVSENGLDFAMNDKCAAGTGSFLEAVARRFHVPIADFGQLAMESQHPARIAGRCAVFGESDIIHKSRSGFAREDLFLGLALAVCRTFLSDVAKGKPLQVPIIGQGGTLLNRAVQHAFRTTLQLGPEEFIVAEDPRHVLCAGALGAALMARGRYEMGFSTAFKGFRHILQSQFVCHTVTCTHPDCLRECDGVVVLTENGLPIAGYKGIDCQLGFFSGLPGSDQRSHMESLLAN